MLYKLRCLTRHNNPKGEKSMKLLIERGKEKINSNCGLAIVGAIIKKLNIGIRADRIKVTVGNPHISNADILC